MGLDYIQYKCKWNVFSISGYNLVSGSAFVEYQPEARKRKVYRMAGLGTDERVQAKCFDFYGNGKQKCMC